ncbi:MAG: hypothetical protein A2918_03805 [Candidatus Yanofskybacteria bacterium RIFCSPLOWO2_01_FULL_42_49]|uniref:Uncharacterized protein n=1 Tax=Candidatus Yanofskybacteria bacterium RIFCSPLOWO2_01_FULL_42_49 TaxID=1802694 RepID=A0A1F8GEI8_9BACT|nr:MAG: hypothetical protein A2918_03805 [Candidatus Yanofskybacteria bacterium RIFCSPLOWO2_01_FULL_42_49]
MADDNKPFDTTPSTKLGTSQDNKPSTTIDELVKELSKSNSSPAFSDKPAMNQSTPSRPIGPPPNLPGVKIPVTEIDRSVKPQGPVPLPQREGNVGTGVPNRPLPNLARPQPFLPPKPATSSQSPQLQPQPPQPAGRQFFQEYKSSIRTMGEDISSIKSGQKPSGVDIPRKITPEARPPMPGVQKPIITPPSGPMPSAIGLGRAEKTGPLPFIPAPKTSEIPKPKEAQPSIIVPGEKKMFPGMRFLSQPFYMLIAGILVVGGFMYWFLVLRVSEPEVAVSPTPSPTITATPSVKSLSEIFSVSGGTPVNFEVSLSDNISNDFKIFVNALTVSRNEFTGINLMEDVEGTLVPVSFLNMFDNALVMYPAGLKDNMADSAVLAYGQSETFNMDGTVNLSVQNLKKISFVARVKDKAAVQAIMTDWEFTIADDLADFLSISDTTKEASVNFLDNAYRGAVIRYKNFPWPDITVDYSLVDFGGQSYLVVAGSREAMYTAIDVLLTQ